MKIIYLPSNSLVKQTEKLTHHDIVFNSIIEIFAQNWITARIMSDASHDRGGGIKAWRKFLSSTAYP